MGIRKNLPQYLLHFFTFTSTERPEGPGNGTGTDERSDQSGVDTVEATPPMAVGPSVKDRPVKETDPGTDPQT